MMSRGSMEGPRHLDASRRAQKCMTVQVRQASTFTESLGGHTGSEPGTAPSDPEDDYSVITHSEATSAAIAAPGSHDSICCFSGVH